MGTHLMSPYESWNCMILRKKEAILKNVRTYDPKGEVPETRPHVKIGLLEHTYSAQFR